MKTIRVILFDFDGVIVNSSSDIASAVNTTLSFYNYPTIDTSVIKSFIGNGARNLIIKSLSYSLKNAVNFELPLDKMNDIFDWYLRYYSTHAVVQTTVYDYIPEILETAYALGIRMAIVSNKPQALTEQILEYFVLDDFFDTVIGPEQLTNMKPAPEGLERAVAFINKSNATLRFFEPVTDPSQVLMVGDSATDIQAGRNYGAKTCAFTGGLGDVSKLLAEKPDITISNLRQIIEYVI